MLITVTGRIYRNLLYMYKICLAGEHMRLHITIDFTFNFQVELSDGAFPQRRETQVSWSWCHAVLQLLKKERRILTE